ncbi:MAG: N-acetyl sugar amidotransferase, partial [Candidatus Hydrogenedentota bacterium]
VKWGLPRKVLFCRRCIMSNQMPSAVVEIKNRPTDLKPTLNFDEDGICHACKYAELKRQIDWKEREQELLDLLDRHRRHDGGYDVIVPSSGGKDSCFAAHLLKHKYGMNPLTVTWAPHIYTEIGWRNFQNLIHAGFDNVLVTPNGKVHRKLTQLAFLNLVHPFQPFIIGQRNVAPRLSVDKGIKLVMYGEHAAEYNSKLKGNFNPRMDHSFYAAPRSDSGAIRISGLDMEQLEAEGVARRELLPYLPLDLDRVEETGTEVHHLSYYQKWDPQANFYYAVENTGFEVNPERTEGTYSKYSSLDDKIDGMHYFTTYIKFGVGRASYDAAQEIRAGHITREEGISLVRRYDGEFPQKYYLEFLEYIGITEEKFREVIVGARSPHLWTQRNGEWVLRHPVS